MNNNITEDYCSFEVSKLLKEKGLKLNLSGKYVFNHNGKWPWQKEGEFLDLNDHLDETCCPNHGVPDSKLIDAPTHSLAIKWIRENFGIHITEINESNITDGFYQCRISIKRRITSFFEGKKSTFEATEAALLHTLQNLIK